MLRSCSVVVQSVPLHVKSWRYLWNVFYVVACNCINDSCNLRIIVNLTFIWRREKICMLRVAFSNHVALENVMHPMFRWQLYLYFVNDFSKLKVVNCWKVTNVQSRLWCNGWFYKWKVFPHCTYSTLSKGFKDANEINVTICCTLFCLSCTTIMKNDHLWQGHRV